MNDQNNQQIVAFSYKTLILPYNILDILHNTSWINFNGYKT